jgi:hypothetical protein
MPSGSGIKLKSTASGSGVLEGGPEPDVYHLVVCHNNFWTLLGRESKGSRLNRQAATGHGAPNLPGQEVEKLW